MASCTQVQNLHVLHGLHLPINQIQKSVASISDQREYYFSYIIYILEVLLYILATPSLASP